MKKLIVVADWASDSLTVQEFQSAVMGFLKENRGVSVSYVSSTPSTIHTAFLLQQITQTEERYGNPLQTVIFQNTDPRIQTNEGVEKAKGAELLIVRLKSGLFLFGPNAGYNLSLVRSKIEHLYTYPGLDKGSQFRSRDLYSRVASHLMNEEEDELELEEVRANIIPGLQEYYVGHIDNYGNIKTTITHEFMKGKYEYGDTVVIRLHNLTKKATYVTNLFGGNPGELVIYPGSSGQSDNPYMEISVWRHFTEKKATTGLHEFDFPRPGELVEIVKS